MPYNAFMRIAIVINTSWNIYNFRLSLIQALLTEGHEVIAIATPDAYAQRLIAAGCKFVPVTMEKGTNPFKDLWLIGRLYQAYKQVKPDVLLHYTIKPNIYGAIAARMAGIPAINNVSGLGTVFIKKDYISNIALRLYKQAFKYPGKVFFQNQDDRRLFLKHNLVRAGITEVLPGSGIDLKAFTPQPKLDPSAPFTFLMIARVLYEKGIAEYMEACRLLKQKYPTIRCQLLGQVDELSRFGIKQTVLDKWLSEGAVDYLGTTDDVATIIAQADCVVLPSYREGTPRTLLEAAAMAKPLIATNVPGCREVVQQNINGLLCRVRNAPDLAEKMEQMLQMPPEQLQKMGEASRHIAETKFDVNFVIQRYQHAIAEVTNHKKV